MKKISLVLSLYLISQSLFSQIITDGSLGVATSLSGPDFEINSYLGLIKGNNLFISLSSFAISNGESVTFNGPASISVIYIRVTGGGLSTFDGLISSNIAGADIVLINPAGISTGANLDIKTSGDIYFTTADYIKFYENNFFAYPQEGELLSTSYMESIGFLNYSPEPILIDGSLMNLSRNLWLLGGDINISYPAFINMPLGNLHIASLAYPGELPISFDYNLDVSDFESLGNLTTYSCQFYNAQDAFIEPYSALLSYRTDTVIECNYYLWIDGNIYTSSNNSAIFNVAGGGSNGCDLLVTLDLTINNIPDVTTSFVTYLTQDDTIIVNNPYLASYQWLDCENNLAIIPGETKHYFTPQVNGTYAVQITEGNCVAISDCISFMTTLGVINNNFGEKLMVYPNPTYGDLLIELDQQYPKINVEVYDLNGKLIIRKEQLNSTNIQITIDNSAGIYFAKIFTSDDKTAIIKIMKQ